MFHQVEACYNGGAEGLAQSDPFAGTGSSWAFLGLPSLDVLPALEESSGGAAGGELAAEAAGSGALTLLSTIGLGLLGAVIPGSAPLSQEHAPAPEPEPAPAAPPGGPTVGAPVAASPEIPPNWWEIGQGGNPDLSVSVPAVSAVGAATLGDVLSNLLQPGNLGDINVTPQSPDLAGLLEPFVPTNIPRLDETPTVVVSGGDIAHNLPVGDPFVVPAPTLEPIVVHTGDVPALPAPDIAPFEALTEPSLGTGPQFSLGPLIVPSDLPGIDLGLVPAPRTGVIPRTGVPRVVPNPLVDPLVPVGAPIVPSPVIVPTLTPNTGLSEFPVTQAQMLTSANQCTATQQRQRGKKRKTRSTCYRGTYEELTHGLLKFRKEKIPCR